MAEMEQSISPVAGNSEDILNCNLVVFFYSITWEGLLRLSDGPAQ